MKKHLRRFRDEEKGAIYVIEFAILAPVLFGSFFFGFELSMHSIRQMQLDRGLEVSTREVRLNTGMDFTHEALKYAICANAGGLEDCEDNLRLEMVPMNPRSFTGLEATADCSDVSLDVSPLRGWSLGEQHELMLLRACYRFNPVFGSIGLGKLFGENTTDGKGKMVSISAFVQEPR
ncbi:TadE/TadG family type IV pilus assembly protein [Sulfitobacter sp.]|uniref:TadE/TadG family type IV pilus assembly protein n=1 Tax=Sulfitobacter sp. TaxID=1903071 RepID=UPI0030016FF7